MALSRKEAASRGGQELVRQRGSEYMAAIGKEGGRAGIRGLASKYFGGSVGEAMAWLRKRGAELKISDALNAKQDAELAAGKPIACDEMSVIESPDDDPFYREDWRERVKGGEGWEIPF